MINIDLSTPITLYEIIAIVISMIALSMQFIPKIYNYFFRKIDLLFIANRDIKLFFNQSGSYIHIYGVFESKNGTTIIRDITAKITRKVDNATYNFSWSTFISPIRQNYSNNTYIYTYETAHPIMITKNHLFSAFIEYADPAASSAIVISNCLECLQSNIPLIIQRHNNYPDATQSYSANPDFSNIRNILTNEFIWKAGEYTLEIDVEYNNKKKPFYYAFNIYQEEFKKLYNNIDEAIFCDLKKNYLVGINFYSANILLHEDKNHF